MGARVGRYRFYWALYLHVLQTWASCSLIGRLSHWKTLGQAAEIPAYAMELTHRGEVWNRKEGCRGGSKHASSFIVASLARNAVRLSALQVWLSRYSGTAAALLPPPGFFSVTTASIRNVSCGRQGTVDEHGGRASRWLRYTLSTLPAAKRPSRFLSER